MTENPAVRRFQAVAGELGVVIPVSFYERDVQRLFNSIAMIDADGSILGVYRKTHIPDDHFYQEKFYFTPGDTGFKVFETRFGAVGVGICWDQWFPETARCMAVQGAEILLYPTAIGSEPILNVDSSGHWRRVMQGHAAANLVPVAAANRIGTETVMPCEENGGQSSSLTSTVLLLLPMQPVNSWHLPEEIPRKSCMLPLIWITCAKNVFPGAFSVTGGRKPTVS